jgi:hypothetical protein
VFMPWLMRLFIPWFMELSMTMSLCSYYKVCTVYQKNTVIDIAVTPLLSARRPINYQAKAVIVYTRPEAESCCTLLPANLLPNRSTGFFIYITNYLIKSIFKDKPSTVLK